jgi:hypothetical protein
MGSVVSSAAAAAAMESCDSTRFMNGTRTYWLGAAGFLNIGLGRGRVGDEEADVDPLGFGLPLAIRAAVSLGDVGDGVGGG